MCKLDSHFVITVEQKNKTHHPLSHLAAHIFPMCNACDSSPAISTATTVTLFACWFLDASTPQFPDITCTLQPSGTLLVFPFECPFWRPGLQPCRVKTWEDRSFPSGPLGVMVIGATPVSTPRGSDPAIGKVLNGTHLHRMLPPTWHFSCAFSWLSQCSPGQVGPMVTTLLPVLC